MNYTLEELIRANNNGTLESVLLSNGQLPMSVLSSVLTEAELTIDRLNIMIEDLDEYNSELNEEITELKRTPF